MVRAVGLATIFAAVILATTSLRMVPERQEEFPSWWRPAAEIEDLPPQQDWNCPIEDLKILIYYTDEQRVPVWIAARMFSTESSPTGSPTDPRWQDQAVSYVGAVGRAQLMPYNLTTKLFLDFNDGRPIDPRDPTTAIRVGVRYLAYLHRMLGSWVWAVEAYNCGPGRFLKGHLPSETLYYAEKIFGRRAT